MLKNILVFPDSSEIASSVVGSSNIRSCTLTESVNNGTELTLGSVCSSMLEAKLHVVGNIALEPGMEIILCKEDEQKIRTKIGVFILEKPTRPTMNTYKITAYDRVILLDKDLSTWISSLDGWPYTMKEFAEMVCQQCGLELADGWDDLPNGDFSIQKFTSNVTGRQLIQWVGEANCRFFRMNVDGKGEFAWYQTAEKDITPDGEIYIMQGTLDYEDYEVSPIEKVWIQLSDNDVGSAYPDVTGDANTYRISGNELLYNGSAESLRLVAQEIYNVLSAIRYTPCQVSIPANLYIKAGNIVNITDKTGRNIRSFIFTKKQTGQRDTLESSGTFKRDSTTVINNETIKNISGKVFTIEKSVDGFTSKISDLNKGYSELTQDAEQMSLRIDDVSGKYIEVKTTVDGFTVTDENGQTLINGGSVTTDNLFLSRLFSKASTKSYVEMLDNGLNFILNNSTSIGIGYYSADRTQPYMVFGAGSTPNVDTAGMIKKYSDGIWIGDSADRNNKVITNGTGIFVDTTTQTIYKYVKGNGVALADTSNVVAVFG